jgi:hypothetical protein
MNFEIESRMVEYGIVKNMSIDDLSDIEKLEMFTDIDIFMIDEPSNRMCIGCLELLN